MSSKISLAVAALVVAFGSVGCSSSWMSKEEHETLTAQLTEYKNALEAENAQLRMKAAEFDRLKAEFDANSESGKFYSDLAASLKQALNGLGMDEKKGDFVVNKERGSIEFKDGVLFDLGSWKISTNGARILKTIADTQKGNVIKVIGHADKKPITREITRKALETDTNMELSCRRAIAVMGELLKHGLRETQIASVEGHGTEPTANNGVARCVEIFIVKGASVAPTSFKLQKPVKK
ncbi:MAG: OmpA family protein [Planctomycetes bacterium]|nr:OmpA family protein [Planctomycetota bacterium]